MNNCAICGKTIIDLRWRPFEDACLECTPKVEAIGWIEGERVTLMGLPCTHISLTWQLRPGEEAIRTELEKL